MIGLWNTKTKLTHWMKQQGLFVHDVKTLTPCAKCTHEMDQHISNAEKSEKSIVEIDHQPAQASDILTGCVKLRYECKVCDSPNSLFQVIYRSAPNILFISLLSGLSKNFKVSDLFNIPLVSFDGHIVKFV